MEQMRGASIPQSHRTAQEISKQYEAIYRSLLTAYGPVASSAPYTPHIDDAIDAEEARRIMLRYRLGIRNGEELISVAVRKDDGSIEARSA